MINPYVKKVKPLENYCLMLWFENGEQKIFDLNPYLNKGVFNQLKNTALFASVRVVAGSVEWSNGIDLSYDTLYLEGMATNLVEERHADEEKVNLQKLGKASPSEIEVALAERETVQPEKELTPEIIAQFQQRLQTVS